MRIFKLLSFRLFVLIFFILAALSMIVSYVQLQSQSQNYQKMITECGMRASALIRGSTRHSMLLNHKEDTYRIIRTLAQQPGIEKIRIYNKNGSIVFSADDTEINTIVNMQDEACYMCHKADGNVIQEPETNERRRIFARSDGHRSLGFVAAIKNEPGCYNADCHFHNSEQTVLGTLDVIMSLKETDEIIATERSRMISANIAVTLLLAFAVGIFIWFFVHIPVNKLHMATQEISSGNLEYKISTKSNDEIGLLAKSFNRMTKDLFKAKKEITEWSNELENRVHAKSKELQETQERNLQIEKMASLGKLSATVAHELNNPIAGILTYSKLIQKKINKDGLSTEEKKSILDHLKLIESESERSGAIVKNMLLFSRKEAKDIKAQPLNPIIETSLQLIAHHLELHNIHLEINLASQIPDICADKNQIKQALLALYVNAVEAMEEEGTLKVRTYYQESDRQIHIQVEDNGKGMTEEVKNQIFEPFYTTKNAVKGFGLGLSVVYGIVQNHAGEIDIESEIDRGTVITIKLPIDNVGEKENEKRTN